MPVVRLIVRYDGSGLSGWQRQRGVPTVQEHLEIAASAMACERIIIRGAGRTDAGVHAFAQVAAFHTASDIPERGWRLGLNSRLPPQVSIREARFTREGFDPRRASAGKRYRYVLLDSADRDPLVHLRAWHVYGGLDLAAMVHEAQDLLGSHDFRAFRASDCDRKTTVRQVFRVHIARGHLGRNDLVSIEVEGTAFLKNMVRIIVGTLVDVGRGRRPPGTIRARLQDGDRTHSGMTAPAHGLYLDTVFLQEAWRLPDDTLQPRPDYAEAFLRGAHLHTPSVDDDD